MASKVQRAIRLEKWMIDAITRLSKEKKTTFSETVNMLLEWELNHLGHTKTKYNNLLEAAFRDAGADPNEQKKASWLDAVGSG